VVEQDAVACLLAQGYVVIAGGGGGIPVVEAPDGTYKGVEAVIDKDATSAQLATALGAGLLAITTGVEQVAVDHGRPTRRPLGRVTASEARRHLADGQFPAGSMGPKVEAALAYLEAAGTPDARVLVTSPAALAGAMRGSGGTWFVRDDAPVTPVRAH
ncbi:amino acid kinase family protein, partial [Streptomyces beijiangensis]|nr:carbamate kinase [Streptomyces beijiangensis]